MPPSDTSRPDPQPAQQPATPDTEFKAPSPYLRLLIPAVAGTAVGLLLPRQLPTELRLLTGWIVFAAGYLLSAWWMMYHVSGDWIRQLARSEDNGRRMSHLLAALASLVSLAGVMSALSRASDLSKSGQHALELWLTGAAMLSVVLSWILIQTIYTLRYAHLYYDNGDNPEGGIDFPNTPEPDYLDFAYLSFTIGMTYQVSDTDITQKPMRMLLTGHALLSYVYGVVIIALSISVVGSLLS